MTDRRRIRLDGMPESIVIGPSLLGGHTVSLAMLIAGFISNLPEALAATTVLSSIFKTSTQNAKGWLHRAPLLLIFHMPESVNIRLYPPGMPLSRPCLPLSQSRRSSPGEAGIPLVAAFMPTDSGMTNHQSTFWSIFQTYIWQTCGR